MSIDQNTKTLINLALTEDIADGDITTEALVDAGARGVGWIKFKEQGVVCGHQIAQYVLSSLDSSSSYQILVAEGRELPDGTNAAELHGTLRALLTAERTMLNFMQRLSGVATTVRHLSKLITGTGAKLVDTRKTTPGWRALEKYAVAIGGAENHRMGLYDRFLIKNNHLDTFQGDIPTAIKRCREFRDRKVEIEVRNSVELQAACSANPDIILLDNMTPAQVKQALEYLQQSSDKEIATEASGGINEQNLRAYAETGVNFISMGALTHSVRSIDISLQISTLQISTVA
jgi:nicotinate-nucleotide pyrophosphorylase (carboxylating)